MKLRMSDEADEERRLRIFSERPATRRADPVRPRIWMKGWMQSNIRSSRDLHARIGPAVEERGYRWGLFRGSFRCPIRKGGALRDWWMRGCRRGIEERRAIRRRG